MIINRAALNDYLDRELDSWLWMKKLTRADLRRELDQLKVLPTFKTKPWLHQLVCFYIGICQPHFLFILDMGLGKSKLIADLLTYALRTRTARRGLVLVPRVVNMSSWRDDLSVHSDLEPCLCNVEDIDEKWYRLSNPTGDLTVIDYHGLALAVSKKERSRGKNKLVKDDSKIRRVQKLYDFVNMDESHYLQNRESLWFSILRQLTKHTSHTYATTGTLFNRDPRPVWSQFYLVDQGETFGDTPGLFTGAFYTPEDNGFGIDYKYNKRRSHDLHRMLQHRSIRYDDDEVPEVELPMRMPPVVLKLEFGAEQKDHYLRALDSLIDAQNTGVAVKMEAPWTRMRQILSGYLEWKDENGAHRIRFKHNPKMDALEGLLDSLVGEKVIIVHYYTETGKLITEMLQRRKIKHTWLYGGTKDKEGAKEAFISDPACQVMVMNSVAGGTGNDGLQKVARYMVMYETPTDPTTRKQVEKRLDRPGQKRRVRIYDLTIARSIDTGFLQAIEEGTDLYLSVVNGHKLQRELVRA